MDADIARRQAWRPYVQIARLDHWFKNVFVLPGLVLALFVRPEAWRPGLAADLLMAVLATCLVASSNYSLNEYLDAPYDRRHPVKHTRPAARGLVRRPLVLTQWLVLAGAGIGLAWQVNVPTAACALWLWVMGILYNVPPVRTKELPYLDVLSEAVNNPIRLLIGWFAVNPDQVPPLSLAVAYWMVGAFFMATKRFAEYRRIGDAERAQSYRGSFKHYDESRLLVSLFFYALLAALFTGVFIVRFQLELILAIPWLAGFLAWYLAIGLRPDSPVQHPERLYREGRFVVFALASVVVTLALLFTHIPALYRVFQVPYQRSKPLWTLELPGADGTTPFPIDR